MFALKHLMGGSVFVFILAGTTTMAQVNRAPIDTEREPVARMPAAPLVTVSATAERVRFVAPGTVIQLRLEVYSETGQKLFDTELHGGNVLDWHLQDGAGARLSTGSYASVLTIKSLSGRLSQRVGVVTVNDKKATIEPTEGVQLSLAQQLAIGPVEGNAAFTVLRQNEAEAITAVTHDGSDGQLSRTRGALSFRVGDFFAGKDKEQMRLTEAGSLGIGTAKPQAKLDVAGVIRTSEGIEFATSTDGTDATKVTKLSTTATGGLQQTLADGTVVPNATGTGTQGRLAKWTDNAGTLGDSVANDTGTALQLTAPPSPALDTNLLYLNSTNGTTGVLAGSTPSYSANNGPFFAMRGNTYTTIANQRGLFTIGAGNVANPQGDEGSVKFNTGNDLLRMVIRPSGNVGIGTASPSAMLDVTGNINTSTQYNIGGQPVLRSMFDTLGRESLFVGVGAGQNTSNTTCCNSFFGGNSGKSNVSGSSNSFFGTNAGLNTTTGNNSFFGGNAGVLNASGTKNSFFGQQAGGNNTAGSSNSFFGERAGFLNGGGTDNSFFGIEAGYNSYSGSRNLFIGAFSGFSNTSENDNTFIGYNSNGAAGITNATAIGAYAVVSQSNSLVLGNNANVGIGTTSPVRKLQVSGTGSDGAGQTDLRITGTGAIASGITLESTGTGGRTYSWLSTADNTDGGGSGPGRLAVFDVTAGLYRMVIDGSGNVGIGLFSPDHKLTVNGTADKPGGGSWDVFSDERLKTIKGRFTPGLKALMQLQPLRYEYKPDNALGINSSGEHVGFGAQAVQKIIPEAVTKNDRGYLLVNNDPILWTMLNAIKEQQQTIEKLTQANGKLRTRNTDTEARLAVIETTMKRMAHRRSRGHK